MRHHPTCDQACVGGGRNSSQMVPFLRTIQRDLNALKDGAAGRWTGQISTCLWDPSYTLVSAASL